MPRRPADQPRVRVRGEGSLRRRPDGRWEGRWRGASVYGDTATEADAALDALIRAHHAGVRSSLKAPTVAAWLGRWLPVQERTLRPKTAAQYRTLVQHWIVPEIGTVKLSKLAPEHLRKLAGAITAAGRSSTTARAAQTILVKACRDAAAEGHDVKAAIFAARKTAKAVHDRSIIGYDDARALISQAMRHDDGSRWIVALLQGLRQGERLGLTWDRVDLDAGLMDISWQLQEMLWAHGCDGGCGRKRAGDCPDRHYLIPDGYAVRPLHGALALVRPKTARGQRYIPIVPPVAAALRRWRQIAPPSPHDLVWPRRDGQPMSGDADRRDWIALQDAAQVARVDGTRGRRYLIHEARHSTASLLMEAGVPETVRIAILGHSSAAVTRAYEHASLDMARRALEAVAGRLGLVEPDLPQAITPGVTSQ